jgi:amino acid adenylation domain-containing protein
LEDAGCDPTTFKGSIGVFAGGSRNRSWEILTIVSGKQAIFGEFAADNLKDKDYLSSRISHKLDLKGPAISMHTACSTALVATDLACRSLLTGQCDAVLAGGVSVLSEIAKGGGYLYEEGFIRSPDGLVRAFDREANGTVFSHGAGVVLLKRLDDAFADGDDIYAVIKGFAANNDGTAKSSFSAPAVDGQTAVIRTALYMAEVEPETITYVEANGTATRLGDPLEIEALKTAFNTNKTRYCAIGSVKTNIGHLDTAAGIAGMIKVALMMKHRQIPPSLNYKNPNPEIDFEHSPFFVNTQLREWETNGEPLRAGLSSFGVGGTNVHLILEQAPGQDKADPPARPFQLLLLSARTANALEQASKNFLDYLKENPHTNLADAAFTLNTGRKAFEHKKMLVCRDANEALEILEQEQEQGQGNEHEQQTIQTHYAKEEKRAIFMFPGQGSQYVDMARGVYETEPVFRQEMDRCFEILKPLMDYDLKEILYPSAEGHRSYRSNESYIPPIDQTEIAQPLIFASEYALAKLLMVWGIAPYAMIGHNIGEYTAACLAGVFSLEDVLFIVSWRGKLMQQMPPGSMLSIALPEPGLKQLLSNDAEGKLDLAAVNGPSQCVVSGTHEDIDAFARQLGEKKMQNRKLHTSHAYHSRMMEPILNNFREKVSQVKGKAPQIPFISNLTGQWFTYEDAANPDYWVRHLRSTVRFADGLKELLKDKNVIFIEVGPGSTLTTFTRQHPDKSPNHMLIDLVRPPKKDAADEYYLLSKLGQTWLYGKPIDWQQFYSREKRHRLHLPTYPFQRQRYWIEGNPDMMIRERMIRGISPGKKADMSQWFYIPSWKRSIIARGNKEDSVEEIPTPTKWLVFAHDDDVNHGNLASPLVERLTHDKENSSDSDGDVTVVKIGDGFARQQDGSYTIAPAQENHYEALIEELQSSGKIPDRIVHLWNLSPAVNENQELVNERVEKSLDLGFYSLIYLAKALGKQPLNREIHITVLTNGMQEVWGETVVFPEKAAVLAPVMIIPREYPDIKCRCIDIVLPPPDKEQEKKKAAHNNENENKLLIDRLLREFKTGISHKDTIIAYRGNYRLVRTFEPIRLSSLDSQPPALRLNKAGVYLITGGLGGIGLVLARYLAKTLQAKLILTGRSAFPARHEWEQWLDTHNSLDRVSQKIRKIRELEALGAEVQVYSVDSADGPAMSDVIAQTCQHFGTINGVIHSAGVPGGGIIQLKTREMAEQVLAPKVKGTLALHRALQDQGIRPDFIVLCSSVNSVLPIIGQVDYCAANAFMDAFAFYNNARDNGNTFTVSINWDTWEEVGMAVEAALANIEEFTMLEVSPEILGKLKGKEHGAPPGSAFAQTMGDGKTVYQEETSQGELVKAGISPLEGVEVFTRILETRDALPQVVVSTRDLASRLEASQIPESPGAADWIPGDRTTGPVHARPDISSPYIAPTTSLQQKMANIWQELLGIVQVGIRDDFFELGGDSLKAVTLIARIRQKFHTNLSVRDIFNASNVKDLSKLIEIPGEPDATAAVTTIKPIEKKEYYAASTMQRRMYILSKMEGIGTTYNLPSVSRINIKLHQERLEQAFQLLIRRHESLRTSFDMKNGVPVQIIHEADDVEFRVDYLDYQGEEEEIHNLIRGFIRPFNLSKAPLMRVGIITLSEEKHLLILDVHHIAADGISYVTMIKNVDAIYGGRVLPGFIIQYKEFSQWHNREIERDYLKKQKLYWINEFKEEIPILNLPMDYSRPVLQVYEGNTLRFTIAEEKTRKLKALALKENATLFMVLIGIFYAFLSKLSGQEDIVVGSPVAGRKFAELENIVGMFINMLPLRNYPTSQKTYMDFLKEIKEKTLEALENQGYPFEILLEELPIKRDLSRNPLFDVMFDLQNELGPDPDLGNRVDYDSGISRFDITLTIFEEKERLVCYIEYCTRLFKTGTIEKFIRYFNKTFSFLVENPGAALREIEILSEEEKQQILLDFNDTETTYPKDKTLHRLFEEQAERIPDHMALLGKDEGWKDRRVEGKKEGVKTQELTAITYKELNEKSRQLTNLLKQKGVGPDTIVALMVERSVEMMMGLLGILGAGCAYLPIDPGYPQARIKYILANSGTKVLVTSRPISPTGNWAGGDEKIFIDLGKVGESPLHPDLHPHLSHRYAPGTCLAYVIYTSGSTGNPKGVMVQHGNAINFIKGMTAIIDFSSGKTITALTTISFDIFFLETLLAVICGLKIFIAAEDEQRDPQLLQKLIRRHNVDMLQLTPSRLKLLLDSTNDEQWLMGIKELLVGGEAFPPGLFKELKETFPGKIYNVYGPTETTIWSTVKDLSNCSAEDLNIGRPICNTQIYILDRFSQPQPIGIPGELSIGGDGVARGYLNNPELTAEKFDHDLWDLWDDHDGDNKSYRSYTSYILYRTGDLARWLTDGEIEFLGRVDHQVKIRGFRIELEEIEEQLLSHGQIKEAVVIDRRNESGDRYLAAYLVPGTAGEENPVNISELKEYLSLRLPYYMVPDYFVTLDKIPLTPNGKVNRNALPEFDGVRPHMAAAYVPPESEKEKIIADIWKGVLKLEQVGIYDNFFDLGGNSLNVIQLNQDLNDAFKKDIPVAALFKYLTISSFIQYLTREETGIREPDKRVNRVQEVEKSKDRLKQRRGRRG